MLSLLGQIAQFYLITVAGGIVLLIVVALARSAYDSFRDRSEARARRPR